MCDFVSAAKTGVGTRLHPEQSATYSIGASLKHAHREQVVCSPPNMLDRLRSVWGVIVLDPCAPEEWTPHYTVNPLIANRLPVDGRAIPWVDRTYCNPPYRDLKSWLRPTLASEDARVAWLVPVRPHRAWWRDWARACDAVIYLDAKHVVFPPHTQCFPGPICLGYIGHDADLVVDAFSDIGGTL